MAVKAVNDTTGPNSLVLTLLIFSTYLRMTKLDLLALLITARVTVVYKAMAEITKLQAYKSVNDTLHY